MKTAPTLTFFKLGCNKGGRQLFKDVDCTLTSGKWLYITGGNGVGKTSLLRMLCGLAPVELGEILWNEEPIHTQREAFQHDLCYLGHLNALQESMTVGENLSFMAALGASLASSDQINEVLARFGVGGRNQQLVRNLSQGQKRRVALARLSLSPARLWVLDEPFVAMDEAGIQMLSELIANHLIAGGLAVLTSHQKVPIGQIPAQILELHA